MPAPHHNSQEYANRQEDIARRELAPQSYTDADVVREMALERAEKEKVECDHEWKFRDDSFDHEFGTEKVHSWECQKCGAVRAMQPADYEAQDDPAELRADYLRDREKDERAEQGLKP